MLEGKGPPGVFAIDPGLGIAEQRAAPAAVGTEIFLKTFYGVCKHGEHQSFFRTKMSFFPKHFGKLIGSQNIGLEQRSYIEHTTASAGCFDHVKPPALEAAARTEPTI